VEVGVLTGENYRQIKGPDWKEKRTINHLHLRRVYQENKSELNPNVPKVMMSDGSSNVPATGAKKKGEKRHFRLTTQKTPELGKKRKGFKEGNGVKE